MTVRSFNKIHPRIAPGAYIDEAALVIGDVTIGADASLWPMVVARGDVQSITIGARTNIQDGSVLHVTSDNPFTPGGFALTIGADVTVGHGVILHACTIDDLSLIGMGSTVLDGAIVHSRVMVGAGSLVSPGKELESGYLYLGSPAKRIRPLRDAELAYLEFSSRHYVDLKNRHQPG
ncbi:MAG: transferase [Gammaproteobacteria bacterium]|nr:MAG: transferase [Gammaproteobacteria bacterium]TND05752.1 MAG: transferase [Gammaproteobacteria bacterium]